MNNDIARQIAKLSPEQRERLLKEMQRIGGDKRREPALLRRDKVTSSFPLSSVQQQLWFLDQLEQGKPLYNICRACTIAGDVNATILQRSLNEVVQRHEALRTTISVHDGQPVQIVAPSMLLEMHQEDLRCYPEENRQEIAEQLALQEARMPFHLDKGPLLRARLLRLDISQYTLILTLHHIIADGWSMHILLHELTVIYKALSADLPWQLPDLSVQYGDYALWQHQILQAESTRRELDYWKRQLAQAPAILELPTDRPFSALQQFYGANLIRHYPAELLKRLKVLSQRQGVTLFMTLLAAFQTLLQRYTGCTDIVVGTTIANRHRMELEGIIGYFANTLPLRCDMSDNPLFSALLQRVRQTTLDAYTHQEIPFDRIVAELQPERSLNITPLFQVIFVLQQQTGDTLLRLGDSPCAIKIVDTGTAAFPLTVSLEEQPDGLEIGIQYSTELFEQATIVRLLESYQTLLEAIVVQPEQQIAELSLLPQHERMRLLAQPQTMKLLLRGANLVEGFEMQAEKTPHALALLAGEEHLTYQALDQQANKLAHCLQARGVGPDAIVALFLSRSPRFLITLLAVLKAGGAYLPLDPTLPVERLALLVKDAHPLIVVTEQALCREWLEDLHTLAFSWDDPQTQQQVAYAPGSPPVRSLHPEQIAMVIYTSGSTGMPKGVGVSHRALMSHTSVIVERFQLHKSDRVLHFAAETFDVSMEELFPSWLVGACVVVWQDRSAIDLLTFQHFVHQSALTVLNLPGSYWKIWLDELSQSRHSFPAYLRCLVVGSEAVYSADIARWLELVGQRDVLSYNAYGVTETTVTNTLKRLQKPLEPGRLIMPIGKALPNTHVYVLDHSLQPVPVGVAGELYIGGEAVSQGYIGRSDFTAERFSPDPFSMQPGSRLYRTGDRVRWLATGDLEYLGRVDQQAKIRGFRIEPGEIESVLTQQHFIREAAVRVWERLAGTSQLVAYIVRQTPDPLEIEELLYALSSHLPGYMLPTAVIDLPALPRSSTGKIAYQALPAPQDAHQVNQKDFIRPRSLLEDILTTLWCELLSLSQVGLYENFFTLGGHSLLATRLMSRLREVLQIDVSLRLLFEFPTVAALAKQLAHLQSEQKSVPFLPLTRKERPEHIPLSFAQQRLWFLDKLHTNSSLYTLALTVWLRGPLHLDALTESFTELLQRHESLHTGFGLHATQPIQVILAPQACSIELLDLTGLPETERQAHAVSLATQETRRPFDLSQGPLLRIQLVRLARDTHLLTLTLHHIIADGWSLEVLFQELSQIYASLLHQQNHSLPELPLQYADYTLWQRDAANVQRFEHQLAYWQRQLANAPALLELPTDKLRPAVPTWQGAHLSFQVPLPLTQKLKSLGQQEGATLFMVLLAAFQILLARYSNQNDVLVGAPIANRHHLQTERLIGLFVNTLVLRCDLSNNPSLRDLLRQVRQRMLEAFAHQDLPFERVIEALRPERESSYTPLFQAMFVLQETAGIELQLENLVIERQEIEYGSSKFDLSLALTETESGLHGQVEYATDLFFEETMLRFTAHYQQLLAAIIAQPEARIAHYSLLSSLEREQLLVSWNATQREYPSSSFLHQLVEEQARQRPQAIAIVAGQQQLSYEQLNQNANQLAHYLQKHDVGPETVVGVWMERSPEAIVALLAILKTGGSYLPIDPAYPVGRLRFVLEDAHVSLLLTQEQLLPNFEQNILDQEVIVFNTHAHCWSGESRKNLSCLLHPENSFHVIYTSGSTGRPKGVQVSHANILNLIGWFIDTYKITANDRLTQMATIAFDAMAWEVWGALTTGARLYLPGEEIRLSPSTLQNWLLTEGITVVPYMPVPIAEGLLRLPWPLQQPLRMMITGGDRLHYNAKHVLPFILYNGYGPTETTVAATMGIAQSPDQPSIALTIGRPIGNYQIYLLDQYLEPVPVGVVGEMFIGGRGIGRGYLYRPDLTAERFLPNPFVQEEGARLYRTGDLARYLSNGEIEFIGRIDTQVKLRGFRIELGEIENVLNQHPAVDNSAVLMHTNSRGEKYLVAYVVATGETIDEIQTYLRQKLPEYMVPAVFMLLEELPTTSNGSKIDRKKLPEPVYALPEEYIPPRDAIEEQLATIWCNLLGLPQISIQQNFFAAGGHSLLAMQLVLQIQELFQVELPLRMLFEKPTIVLLAEVVRQAKPLHAPVAVQTSHPREGKRLEDLLTELDQLTDEEVEALLARHEQDRDNPAE